MLFQTQYSSSGRVVISGVVVGIPGVVVSPSNGVVVVSPNGVVVVSPNGVVVCNI